MTDLPCALVVVVSNGLSLDRAPDHVANTQLGLNRSVVGLNEHGHPFGHGPATGGHESVRSRYNLLDIKKGDLVKNQVSREASLMLRRL